ncbi:galactose-specific lectin nattectin-like [Lepisosteus oculatus]|uniref:galactose-specific lectin nattectin-like n=1 Tax=Lepisosteus oculatus TaxID=7918 RepID=UPI0037151535
MIRLPISAPLCIVLVFNVDSVSGRRGSSRVSGELCLCPCPPGWLSFGDRYFKHIGTQKTWADVEIECIKLDGNLASVHSEEENTFLLQLINSIKASYTWIGGSDSEKEGTWLWSDGSQLDFTKWGNGQPDNYGVENCIKTPGNLNIGGVFLTEMYIIRLLDAERRRMPPELRM